MSKVKKFEWVKHSKQEEWETTTPQTHKSVKKYSRKGKNKNNYDGDFQRR